MPNHHQDDISFDPLVQDLRTYNLKTLASDFWAGIAVAFLSIPQAIAYSIVAGLPPASGIIATVLGTSVSALLGSSRQLVIGPGNATTLLVQTASMDILYKYYQHVTGPVREAIALEIMAAMTLVIGIFQILAAIFKFGRVIQFVSHAVVIGYIAGAAVALSADQLFNFFGVPPPEEANSLYEKLQYFITHFDQANFITTFVGVISFTLLIVLKRLKFKLPTSLTMIFVVTLFVQLLGISNIHDHLGRTIAEIGDNGISEGLLPSLQLPLFEIRLLNGLLPIAFAIALIGMLETSSVAKSIATNTGQRLSSNQEIFSLGVSNTFLSFFGALPCSASISRSMLNYESGAKTRFAAFLSGVFVAILASLFGFLIQYIPLAALAALILATAIRMVDTRQLAFCLRTTHSDAFVLIVTFLSCIFFSLQIAFYIGILLSIMFYLRKAAVPDVAEYVYNDVTEELRPLAENEKQLSRKIRIINVEGELFFGSVDLFQSSLKAMAEDDGATKVIVLRIKHVRDMDATGALALKQLHDYLKSVHRHLVVASIPHHVWDVLEKAKLVQYMGRQNLLLFDESAPHSSVEKALQRARELVDIDIKTPQAIQAHEQEKKLALEVPVKVSKKNVRYALHATLNRLF